MGLPIQAAASAEKSETFSSQECDIDRARTPRERVGGAPAKGRAGVGTPGDLVCRADFENTSLGPPPVHVGPARGDAYGANTVPWIAGVREGVT